MQDATIVPYLSNLTKKESSNIIILTDYSTNKDRQIDSDINTQNTEILKVNNYTDDQILSSNSQLLDKTTYYNPEIIKEISSDSTNLIKDLSTTDINSEIIDEGPSNHNNEMTNYKKEQLTYSISEISEMKSELSSEITEKISDFKQIKSDFETAEKKIEFNTEITEKILYSDSGNLDKSDYNYNSNSNSFIDLNNNSNNIEKSTDIITRISSKLSEFENDITERQETYLSNNQEFIISPEKCLCGDGQSYFLLKNNECVNYCIIDQLLDKTCQIDCVFKNNYNSIIRNIKGIIHKENFTDNEEIIIQGNNIICDIITSQMEHKYKNISYIDFGECETKLKQKNNIDYLLIIKFDSKLNKIGQ